MPYPGGMKRAFGAVWQRGGRLSLTRRSVLVFLVFLERQGRGVHAEAQTAWPGAIVKKVAELAAPAGAENFGAVHAVAMVGLINHVFRGDWREETRPAGTGMEL